jgi:hypothetical protein
MNASIRQLVFVKYMSELRAQQLSTLTLILLCSVYTWFVFPYMKVQNIKQSLLIGLVWVALTILFEFSLGRLTNRSWSALLQDYNFISGRIWLIFLLSLFLLPYLIYTIKKQNNKTGLAMYNRTTD